MISFDINQGPLAPYHVEAGRPQPNQYTIRVDDRNDDLVGMIYIDHANKTVDVILRSEVNDFTETSRQYGSNFFTSELARWIIDNAGEADTPIPLS